MVKKTDLVCLYYKHTSKFPLLNRSINILLYQKQTII